MNGIACSSLMRKFLKQVTAVFLGVVVMWVVGCSSTPPAPPSDAAPPVDTSAPPEMGVDKLRVNDVVTIMFSGISSPPPTHEERIREDGTIQPSHLFPPIHAAGKTVLELQRELGTAYSKYYRNLTVTVRAEGRFFVVRGEVKSPNRHPYVGQMSVLRAIAAAGDFTDFANRKRVELTRSTGQKIVVDCVRAQRDPSQDLPVYPNDQIYVPRRVF